MAVDLSIVGLGGGSTSATQTAPKAIQQTIPNMVNMPLNDFLMILFLVSIAVWIIAVMFSYIYRKVIIPKMYEFDVTLKYVTNGRVIIRETMGRIKNEKPDSSKFKLKGSYFKNLTVPVPLPDAIDVISSGRKYIRGYVLDDHVVWATEQIEKLNLDSVIEKIEPLTQEERSNWVNQNRKAERDKINSIGQIIMQFLPYLILIVIIVLMAVFWNKFTDPMIKAGNIQLEIQKTQIELIDKLTVFYKIEYGIPLNSTDRALFNVTNYTKYQEFKP